MPQAPTDTTTPFRPVRLAPGDDLRAALEAQVAPGDATGCFVVSGIGSLSDPRLRLAGADAATLFPGDHEIVSLAGTITADGAHLHMVIASASGAVIGGHVVAGNRIRTTAEVLLVAVTGWRMSRAPDVRTGYPELVVAPDGAGDAAAGLAIAPARFPEDRDAVVAIFREYIASARVSLAFQDPAQEFDSLPGRYAAPDGRLLLVRDAGEVVGCAALRRVDATTCELKRVYLRPTQRGAGAGRRLVCRMLVEARAAGYTRVALDVLPEFVAAQRLYRTLGFVDADPVSHNPVPGTRFLALDLV